MTPMQSFWRSAPSVPPGEVCVAIVRRGWLVALFGCERLAGESLDGLARSQIVVEMEALGFSLVTAYSSVREFVEEETWVFQESVVEVQDAIGAEDLDTTEWTSPRLVDGVAGAAVFLPRG